MTNIESSHTAVCMNF